MGQLVLRQSSPHPPISTSVKTRLKAFLFLSRPFYYHNMNIITVLLFHYFLLLYEEKGQGAESFFTLTEIFLSVYNEFSLINNNLSQMWTMFKRVGVITDSTLGKILELNNFQNYVEINFEVSLYTH